MSYTQAGEEHYLIDGGEGKASVPMWQTWYLCSAVVNSTVEHYLVYVSRMSATNVVWFSVIVFLHGQWPYNVQLFQHQWVALLSRGCMEQWERTEINMTSNQCQSVLKHTLLMELLTHSFISTISVSVKNRTILNLELEVSSETKGFN